MSSATPAAAAPARSMSAVPRSVWIGGGLLCAVTAGLASALVFRTPSPPPAAAVATPVALVAPADAPLAAISTKPLAAPVSSAPKPVRPVKPSVQTATASESPTHLRGGTTAAALCASCGTVEAVNAVQEKGEGTGMGAVAGGVLGGVVGHQVGGGNGKTAMTVIGALGGGLAGHEVEKRIRSETRYDVKVRMEDGSSRVFRQAQSIAIGTRVVADGTTLRVARDALPSGEAQMVRTSSSGGGRT